MDIVFGGTKIRKACASQPNLVRTFGPERAGHLRRRLDELAAASTLAVMRVLPGHCHELRGDRAGQLSLDLDGPYRLIFQPADNPLPTKPDGGLDWDGVTTVCILEVTNTHE